MRRVGGLYTSSRVAPQVDFYPVPAVIIRLGQFFYATGSIFIECISFYRKYFFFPSSAPSTKKGDNMMSDKK
ncbi:MAG: hypothetical protein ACI4U2_05525, partial [Christensenellaceae bacterium]